MATHIQVKLDPTAVPPVTVIPPKATINRGNQTIEWTPFANESFTFISLTIMPESNPFSTPVITNPPVGGPKISVNDNNQATGDYTYVIVVSLNNVLYSSAAESIVAGGNTPVIHNN